MDDAWQSCGTTHHALHSSVAPVPQAMWPRSVLEEDRKMAHLACVLHVANLCSTFTTATTTDHQLQGLALCDHGILKLVTLAGPAWHSQCTGALRERVCVAQNPITTGNMLQRHFDVTMKQSARMQERWHPNYYYNLVAEQRSNFRRSHALKTREKENLS